MVRLEFINDLEASASSSDEEMEMEEVMQDERLKQQVKGSSG